MQVEIEKTVFAPIENPDTDGKSLTFEFAGVIDRLERDGSGKVVDWKTASDPQRFLNEKRIGFQCELYALACEAAGVPITEVEYRIIQVPTIKLCGIDMKASAASGGRLTPEACYVQRCVEWILAEPDRLVEDHRPINRARMVMAKAWLWECSKRILENRNHERWLPNEHACHRWERECPYMPLCLAVAAGMDWDWIVGERYEVRPTAHPELGANGNGKRDVLTYTSLSTLCLCEQLYNWRYERKLTPKRDDSDALWTGSAAHVGLEAFASGGLASAAMAIESWRLANPALGEQVDRVTQAACRARAIVTAAAKRWL